MCWCSNCPEVDNLCTPLHSVCQLPEGEDLKKKKTNRPLMLDSVMCGRQLKIPSGHKSSTAKSISPQPTHPPIYKPQTTPPGSAGELQSRLQTIPITMLGELTTMLSESWSWWFNGEHTVVLFTSTLVVLALFWIAIMFIKRSTNGRPSLPPGPNGLPLVGNLLSLDPELHTYFATLAQTYGPILTLWLGKKIGIVVSSPAAAREVLRDQDTTFANRDVPVAGKEAAYGGSDIVWTPYGPKWRMLRKVCVREMLSNATLDSVYSLRRREIRQTIKYLYNRAGSPANVGEQMFLTVLNVITNMLWGGTVKGEERKNLGAEFRQVVTEMTELLGMPNVSDFYPGLARFDLQGIKKKMKGLAERFDRIFETMIDQRVKMDSATAKESKDFLQVLLQLKDEGDAKMPLTMTHLKALLMVRVLEHGVLAFRY
ncbi:unnamed protein product [Ilex paraguariensis]|uniref:Uncharacterized protein n=1 Tax=Ilex paraguariensis TaxID=185542 RepID=A0ABC8TZA3_9AQUA